MADEPNPLGAPPPAAPAPPPAPKKKPWLILLGVLAALVPMAVCLIGVLAAIAIPSFMKFVRRAKAAEAANNVHAIARGVSEYCLSYDPAHPDTQRGLPPEAGPLPPAPSSKKVLAGGDLGVGWDPGEPVYYSYRIERPDAEHAHIVAIGDIDDDGEQSTFEMTCSGPPDCRCSGFQETNELE